MGVNKNTNKTCHVGSKDVAPLSGQVKPVRQTRGNQQGSLVSGVPTEVALLLLGTQQLVRQVKDASARTKVVLFPYLGEYEVPNVPSTYLGTYESATGQDKRMILQHARYHFSTNRVHTTPQRPRPVV